MNEACVPDDGGALVCLQRADEMPSQNAPARVPGIGVKGGHVGKLGGSFLVAVLAHVSDAKFCKQHNV